MILDANQEGFSLNERLWPATDGKLSALNAIVTSGFYGEFPKDRYKSDYARFF